MRRLVLAALILSAITINPPSSDAASHRGYNQRSSQTFFGKLMEIERRKNAWLMSFFFGL